MKIVKMVAFVSMAALTGYMGGAYAAAPESEPIYFSGAQLMEGVAKTNNGTVSKPIPFGKEVTMSKARRDADGVVEVHTKLHDVIIPQGGHAVALVGGKVEGNKQEGPNEFRGGTITGGKKYDLKPGDVLWIPAGTPHQMLIEKGGSFDYIFGKFEAQK